jgi:hypothetical protein
MNLTGEQVKLFWREWPKGCRANNWTIKAEIEATRKELLIRCGFDSLTKVDRLDGFSRRNDRSQKGSSLYHTRVV